MTREEAKQLLPIIKAFSEGKVIEARTKPSVLNNPAIPNKWTELKELEYWGNTEYRIKPQPKYRPFQSAEECWQEMQKHQPFGWIKASSYGQFFVTGIRDADASFGCSKVNWESYDYMFDEYTFADGEPFGVKEE